MIRKKLLFCRDKDGECSLWDAKLEYPTYNSTEWNSTWDIKSEVITGNSISTFKYIGKGFHGIKKGKMKPITIEIRVVNEGEENE